jgi:DNA polymerase I-like protein with 3'-5' exonuclease and polymerase domains
MLRLCQPGEDAHTYMGAAIAGVSYEALLAAVKAKDKASKPARQLGKVANLSLQYRTTPRKLRVVARVQYGLPMELPEAARIHGTYHGRYKGVEPYWNRQIVLTRQKGYVETYAGRRVQVLGDWSDSREGWAMGSTAINYRIQGTGADQKYLAIASLAPVMEEFGAEFRWDLHDGLYFFVREEQAKGFAIEAKEVLDNLDYANAWGFEPPIPLPWDGKWGGSWGALEEIDFEALH